MNLRISFYWDHPRICVNHNRYAQSNSFKREWSKATIFFKCSYCDRSNNNFNRCVYRKSLYERGFPLSSSYNISNKTTSDMKKKHGIKYNTHRSPSKETTTMYSTLYHRCRDYQKLLTKLFLILKKHCVLSLVKKNRSLWNSVDRLRWAKMNTYFLVRTLELCSSVFFMI